jgi:predicted dehydrogenase
MKRKKLRYALIGAGHISQVAVLPSFTHCKSSELSLIVSSDEKKRKVLGAKYKVHVCSPDEFEGYASELGVDVVYIAEPNHLHKEFTLRAAKAGMHVLCEKPMAVNSKECQEMIDACQVNRVKLMIAYRLHFEEATLTAIDLVNRKNKIGDLRLFQSLHSQPTNFPNIRTMPISQGGGPTYDVGVYDINASRYIFQEDPISVFAQSANNGKPPYRDIEEAMSVILKFPEEKLATMLYSFGAADTETMRVVGTKGDLQIDPAYGYVGDKKMKITVEDKSSEKTFHAKDQFAGEIDYFSECVLKNKEPEASGKEGLIDIQIVEAIHESARTGAVIQLNLSTKKVRPNVRLVHNRPPVKNPPKPFHAQAPSRKKAA